MTKGRFLQLLRGVFDAADDMAGSLHPLETDAIRAQNRIIRSATMYVMSSAPRAYFLHREDKEVEFPTAKDINEYEEMVIDKHHEAKKKTKKKK